MMAISQSWQQGGLGDGLVLDALHEGLQFECQARERFAAAAQGIQDPQLRLELDRFLTADAHWQHVLRERLKPHFVQDLFTCLAEPE
jgi:hypothetical protein